MAGERGVTAALLAETGFQATELGLEGVQGFAQSFFDGHLDVDALLDDLGDVVHDHAALDEAATR